MVEAIGEGRSRGQLFVSVLGIHSKASSVVVRRCIDTDVKFCPTDVKMSDRIPQISIYTLHHFSQCITSNLAYLHVVEPQSRRGSADATTNESNGFIHYMWALKPLIVAGDLQENQL